MSYRLLYRSLLRGFIASMLLAIGGATAQTLPAWCTTQPGPLYCYDYLMTGGALCGDPSRSCCTPVEALRNNHPECFAVSPASELAITLPAPPMLAAGGNSSFAIAANGLLHGWGDNTNGKLGLGTRLMLDTPDKMGDGYATDLPAGLAAALGGWHSAAIKRDGSLWTWGNNGYRMHTSLPMRPRASIQPC